MPGPFPGMDPYLENTVLWPGVHQRVISSLSALLNANLPPGYVADIGERVYLMPPERSIYPDVIVFEQQRPSDFPSDSPASSIFGTRGGGGTATATAIADLPMILETEPIEMREVFAEVRPVENESRVVAVIEVLSYVNKTPGQKTRTRYLNKQNALLQSGTHLIEVDLLCAGEHTVAVPLETLHEHMVLWDYLICLHRGEQGERFEVWPRTVRDRLPRIRVPLENGLPDVTLDVQEAFDRNYDEGAYARRIDYGQPPSASLREVDNEWSDRLLREHGVRS